MYVHSGGQSRFEKRRVGLKLRILRNYWEQLRKCNTFLLGEMLNYVDCEANNAKCSKCSNRESDTI